MIKFHENVEHEDVEKLIENPQGKKLVRQLIGLEDVVNSLENKKNIINNLQDHSELPDLIKDIQYLIEDAQNLIEGKIEPLIRDILIARGINFTEEGPGCFFIDPAHD